MAFTGTRCIATSAWLHLTRTPPLSKYFCIGRFATGQSSSHLHCSSTWQSLRALCPDTAPSNTVKGDHSTPKDSKRRSPQLVDMEYAELNLKENVGEFGGVRTRQHVNPLKASLMTFHGSQCYIYFWNFGFNIPRSFDMCFNPVS